LITGSTGLIGSALCDSLRSRGTEVIRLVRQQPSAADEVFWDPTAGQLDQRAVEGFDAVVHLAGAGIGDKRWSEARRRLIVESRTGPTQLLADRLATAAEKPKVLVSASAIGFYGNRAEPVDESSGAADPPDFLSTVAIEWEKATSTAEDAGIRTTHIRTGIVLSEKGGALGKLLIPFRAGFGGRLGSGDTWWSWITLEDEVRAIEHVIASPLQGAVNLTGPNPVTNAELTKVLGEVLRRPTFFPVPRVALNAALGTELAEALLFTSARVMPAKLESSGFIFNHRTIEAALRSLLSKDRESR
jgi:uncharacterized protein (TIGR01777 family)